MAIPAEMAILAEMAFPAETAKDTRGSPVSAQGPEVADG
jgi:hypothetical protein